MRYPIVMLASAIIVVVFMSPGRAIADGSALSPDARTAQTIAALNSEFEDVDLSGLPLFDALDWVHEKHPKVQFQIDESILKNAGIDLTKTLVSLEKKHVRLKDLLRLLLDKGNSDLGYTVRDGLVVISTKEKLGSSQKDK